MNTNKIEDDKYYTDKKVVKICMDYFNKCIDKNSVVEFLEPSAGSGNFLDFLNKPFIALDILPEREDILKADYLKTSFKYKQGRCIIGNPPYGERLYLAQKFFKKAIHEGDYIGFILPISQLNNSNSFYEFDLISSTDLGVQKYTDRQLHCCFNIYKRPENLLNKKKKAKLKDVTILRQDSKRFKECKIYDIIICYWGNGSAGKIYQKEGTYSSEYKIIINDKNKKEEIIDLLNRYDWSKRLKTISALKINQFHIVDLLKEKIKGIE